MRIPSTVPIATLALPILLTGCALTPTAAPTTETGVAIQGRVHGGQQPIVGAHVYLFAANTSGYGQPSLSLLSAASTGNSDAVGAYVLTASDGSFSISGDYSCTPTTQVYVYALGGNPGAGTNAASGLLAILGNCPAAGNFAASTPYVWVNEVSTIAAAYAFAGFAVDATHVSSSGTALAQQGIANAFANAANLASLSTGAALATTPAGNGAVPQAVINSLANILAACVNSNGQVLGPTNPTNCYALFFNAESSGSFGNIPSDTATAAINIAHNPGTGIAALYNLQYAAGSPFAPALPSQPNDFTVGLNFSGGGLNGSTAIAIDGSGDAWISGNTVVVLSPSGAFASGASGYHGGGLSAPEGIAIDLSGNAWIANYSGNSVVKISPSGAFLSGTSGYTSSNLDYPLAIAVDASNNVWVTNQFNFAVAELSNSGTFIGGDYTGGGIDYPYGVAIDTNKNTWVASGISNAVTEISKTGTFTSGSTGYTGLGLDNPHGIAIDASGDVWIANDFNKSVTEISSTGSLLNTFTGGGLQGSNGLAMDGAGNAWIANSSTSCVTEISSAGVVVTGSTGYIGGGIFMPSGIAVDGSGNVWVANGESTVVELIGAATPVVTPIVQAVKNGTLGTEP